MNSILEKITPLILTFNEGPNIGRTLQALSWAKEIVVVDSYSTDDTLEILRSHPHTKIFQRKFDSFASQCNYGLEKIESEWVLSLDADYVLSRALIEQLRDLQEDPQISSYTARFKYCVFGQPLRGTLLPPRKVLYRRSLAVYHDDGHAHRVLVEGQAEQLNAPIYHDDRKSLSRWLWAQDRYMIIEAKKILETPNHALSWSDRIRKQKVLAPFLILFYCLFVHRGILDGWAGWYYAAQRVLAELLLAIHLIEKDNFCREK
jgi:glycosyltransferase involved in cell wall biosynthesis